MSQSRDTPDKGRERLLSMLAKSNASSGNAAAGPSGSNAAAINDPSPARTFGDSAGEGSVPQTPQHVHQPGK